MIVRPMEESDLDGVVIVENACFSDPWSRGNFIDSLKEPTAYLLVMTGESSDEKDGRTAGIRPDVIIGYCCLYHMLDEGEIVNVAVAPEYRQNGYGAALVRALLRLGISLGAERFFLEVRSGNTAAKQLYESLGFESCGIRKDFYSSPVEDAVSMVCRKEVVCQ